MNAEKEWDPKWNLYIAEYLANNCNGTEAYLKVYGSSTRASAASGSSDLLRNPEIKEKIRVEIDKILEDKAALTLRVVREWEKLAFSDVKDFVDPVTGKVNCTNETDSAALESYKSKVVYIEEMTDGKLKRIPTIVPEYKMYDKNRALESLAKYVIGFTEKSDINITKLDELVAALRQK